MFDRLRNFINRPPCPRSLEFLLLLIAFSILLNSKKCFDANLRKIEERNPDPNLAYIHASCNFLFFIADSCLIVPALGIAGRNSYRELTNDHHAFLDQLDDDRHLRFLPNPFQ